MANKVKYYDSAGKSYDGYNIDGKTYKDEAGTQRIDKGSYVQTEDNWFQMGNTGGVKVNTPEFAGGWIGNIKTGNPTTEKANTPKTLTNYGSYENMLADIPYPTANNENIKNMQGQIGEVISALQNFTPTKSMGRDESQARSYAQLNSIYNQNLEKQLDEYNRDAVSRGMFGQLPTEALKQNAISESEVNKAAAIGDLASNLYTQDFNMARQTDADTLNRQNALLSALGQNYGIEADLLNNQRADFVNLSNLATQETTQKYNNAVNKLNTLGYADQAISDILGVPVGTPSEQINLLNIQDKMQREMLNFQSQLDRSNAAYKASLSGSKNSSNAQNITIPQRLDIWQQAVNMLTKEEPVTDNMTGRVTGYQKVYPSYDEVNSLYLQLISSLGYDPSDLMLLQDLQSEQQNNNKTPQAYSNPLLDAIRSETGAKFWGR